MLQIFFFIVTRPQNCSIAVVGKGEDLNIYDDDDVNPYLEGLDQEERRGGAGASKDAPAAAPAEGEGEGEEGSSAPPPPPADDQAQVCT